MGAPIAWKNLNPTPKSNPASASEDGSSGRKADDSANEVGESAGCNKSSASATAVKFEDLEDASTASSSAASSLTSFDTLRDHTERPHSTSSASRTCSRSTTDSSSTTTPTPTPAPARDDVSNDSAFESPAFLRRARRPEVPVVTSAAPIAHRTRSLLFPSRRRLVSPSSEASSPQTTRHFAARRKSRSFGSEETIDEAQFRFWKGSQMFDDVRPGAPEPK